MVHLVYGKVDVTASFRGKPSIYKNLKKMVGVKNGGAAGHSDQERSKKQYISSLCDFFLRPFL